MNLANVAKGFVVEEIKDKRYMCRIWIYEENKKDRTGKVWALNELINAPKTIKTMEDGEFCCLLRFSIVLKSRR